MIVKLLRSESFVQASAYGQSVVEYARFGKAVDTTRELCHVVRKSYGFPEETLR